MSASFIRYDPSLCPFRLRAPTCTICPKLVEIDDEILQARNKLAELTPGLSSRNLAETVLQKHPKGIRARNLLDEWSTTAPSEYALELSSRRDSKITPSQNDLPELPTDAELIQAWDTFFRLPSSERTHWKILYGIVSETDTQIQQPLNITELGNEIIRTWDTIIALSEQRASWMSNINRGLHDPLTSKLPVELLSEIFKLFCSCPISQSTHHNTAPLLIGQVCKRWREVTLAMPRLWTKIWIKASVPSKMLYNTHLAAQWLGRSKVLPLSLDITFETGKQYHHDLLRVFKEHSARWNNVVIHASCFMAHNFLKDLEQLPTCLENLTIYNSGLPNETPMLTLPTELREYYMLSTIEPAVGWGRLTNLDIHTSLHIDIIVHIIINSPNLESCSVESGILEENVQLAHAPSHSGWQEPTCHHSLRTLEIRVSAYSHQPFCGNYLLLRLTLPSLKSLRCYHSLSDFDLFIIDDFLQRSSPQLDHFHLLVVPTTTMLLVFWPFLTQLNITSLEYRISGTRVDYGVINITSHFLCFVGSAIVVGALPKLQQIVLDISTDLKPDIWQLLAGFLDHIRVIYSQSASNPNSTPPAPVLRSVVVQNPVAWALDPEMCTMVPLVSMHPLWYAHLLEMDKRSPVKITFSLVAGDSYSFEESLRIGSKLYEDRIERFES